MTKKTNKSSYFTVPILLGVIMMSTMGVRTAEGQVSSTTTGTQAPIVEETPKEELNPFYLAITENNNPPELTAQIQQLRMAISKLDTKYYVPMAKGSETMWRKWANTEWIQYPYVIQEPQMILVVNRNPRVQRIAVMIAYPDKPWTLLWVSKVSTGQTGRFDHYITPTGVFDYDGSVLGYRAMGTKNKNGIRGLGKKGSRVWDFGWQSAETGWLKNPDIRQIRMMLHATDPDYIEPRLGRPASKGCIHVSDGMNKFLDKYGALDKVFLSEKATSRAVAYLLPKDSTPVLPGQFLIIVSNPLPVLMKPTTEGRTKW